MYEILNNVMYFHMIKRKRLIWNNWFPIQTGARVSWVSEPCAGLDSRHACWTVFAVTASLWTWSFARRYFSVHKTLFTSDASVENPPEKINLCSFSLVSRKNGRWMLPVWSSALSTASCLIGRLGLNALTPVVLQVGQRFKLKALILKLDMFQNTLKKNHSFCDDIKFAWLG